MPADPGGPSARTGQESLGYRQKLLLSLGGEGKSNPAKGLSLHRQCGGWKTGKQRDVLEGERGS